MMIRFPQLSVSGPFRVHKHDVALILLGLGVLELSMSPNAIAEVRGVIRKTSMLASEHLAKIALSASDPEDVMVLAKEHIQSVAPEIASILG